MGNLTHSLGDLTTARARLIAMSCIHFLPELPRTHSFQVLRGSSDSMRRPSLRHSLLCQPDSFKGYLEPGETPAACNALENDFPSLSKERIKGSLSRTPCRKNRGVPLAKGDKFYSADELLFGRSTAVRDVETECR
jgi:hypothetical protein